MFPVENSAVFINVQYMQNIFTLELKVEQKAFQDNIKIILIKLINKFSENNVFKSLYWQQAKINLKSPPL